MASLDKLTKQIAQLKKILMKTRVRFIVGAENAPKEAKEGEIIVVLEI